MILDAAKVLVPYSSWKYLRRRKTCLNLQTAVACGNGAAKQPRRHVWYKKKLAFLKTLKKKNFHKDPFLVVKSMLRRPYFHKYGT